MIYEWDVRVCNDGDLSATLNEISSSQPEWEIFSVVPTLAFEKKVMGAVIPSGVKHNIILRRSKKIE